jgi:CRP-like cAMP-binding protein
VQGNILLDSLPTAVFDRLRPHFEKVLLPTSRNVFNCGDWLDYVYFPLDAVFHLFTTMENGATVESGTIGREGVIGLSAFFGFENFVNHATVISSNKVLRIAPQIIKAEFDTGGILQRSILRYAHSFFVQITQTAACNRIHPMETRVCRWLLVMSDKARSNKIVATQEFIARMLGTQRPYVTTAIGLLQKQGVIVCGRGYIEIIDCRKLIDCACECYPIIHQSSLPPAG